MFYKKYEWTDFLPEKLSGTADVKIALVMISTGSQCKCQDDRAISQQLSYMLKIKGSPHILQRGHIPGPFDDVKIAPIEWHYKSSRNVLLRWKLKLFQLDLAK